MPDNSDVDDSQLTLDDIQSDTTVDTNALNEGSNNAEPTGGTSSGVETDSDSKPETNFRDTHENVAKETLERLNARQRHLLVKQVEEAEQWMAEEGLAESTIENYLWRVDQARRAIWDLNGSVQTGLPQALADEYIHALDNDDISKNNGDNYSSTSKRKIADALEAFYRFCADERGGAEWESPVEFEDEKAGRPDAFTCQERYKLREAALEYGSLPSYSDCSAAKRQRLNSYLAQRLGKPVDDIGPDDWESVSKSWERASLVWVALDAGLRPIEVARATVDWVQSGRNTLCIPKEDAAKNRENWVVALREDTADILDLWLEQRDHLPKYDDSDRLWLTRERNPWDSDSLNYLLDQLTALAGIDVKNRWITWYSIRHSIGSHMTDEAGIEQTRVQLRHKSLSSTEQYTDPSPESRREALSNLEGNNE